jgi:hypothetical protein
VFGATAGFILLGLINLIFQVGLTFNQVFGYGLIGGLVIGMIMGYVAMIFVARYVKRKVLSRLGNFGFIQQFLFNKRRF